MKGAILAVLAVVAAFVLGRLSVQGSGTAPPGNVELPSAQNPEPACEGCEAAFISAEEIAEYVEVAKVTGLTDQQVRSVNVGNTNVQVTFAHRGALEAPKPNSVAEHDLVTEVYIVLSGSGTNRSGPDLVDKVRRSSDNRSVVFLNGPGHNAADIRNSATQELKPGDVFIIPDGTGHQFTEIDDHITYLMVRIDPNRVVPLLDAQESRTYLDENMR